MTCRGHVVARPMAQPLQDMLFKLSLEASIVGGVFDCCEMGRHCAGHLVVTSVGLTPCIGGFQGRSLTTTTKVGSL